MGLFDLFSQPGDAELYAARDALDTNADAERAAGVTEETDEYLRLNQAVANAEQGASWWARFNR